MEATTYQEGYIRGIEAGVAMSDAQRSAAIMDMVVWARQKIDALMEVDYPLGYIAGLAASIVS